MGRGGQPLRRACSVLITAPFLVNGCLHNFVMKECRWLNRWISATCESGVPSALPAAREGLRADNIQSKTLFLILPLTWAQIRLRAAQISSENLWRDLRCPSASLKVFVLQIQYKGACRHLDPCCAADAAQGHANPPCDIQQQQKNYAVKLLQHSANQQLPQLLTKGRSVYFFLFSFFLFFFLAS